MNQDLECLCVSLETLATNIKNAWGNDGLLVEAISWNCPSLTRHDLAAIPAQLAHEIRTAAPDELGAVPTDIIKDLPRRLLALQNNTVPQMFNGGNATQAVAAFTATMMYVRQLLAPLLAWQVIDNPNAMPHTLARKVRSFAAQMERIAPQKEELEQRISDIQRAHAAAESLPVDMQALEEARKVLSESVKKAETILDAVNKDRQHCLAEHERVAHLKAEAEKTLSLCEEAYRASTTRGLASAFDERAKRHGLSMVGWVVGLLFALAVGTWAGKQRVEMLSQALTATDPKWGVIAMHGLLSIASIAAPIWFAWLATKQIGQRFRLAEDYCFKASVAKAYEGYRKEAARIDQSFEKRLFDSALTRLEEAPLRLVESETHGSPWHELISSDAFMKALEMVPELKDKCANLPSSSAKKVEAALAKLPKKRKGEKKETETASAQE